MKYNLILAKSKNNVIGKDNKIVWSKPSDMKMFRQYTTNNVIIMGRKTFDSFGSKPLKNRINIVLSRNKNFIDNLNKSGIDGLIGCSDIDDAHRFLLNANYDKSVFVIGGAEIYNQYLDTRHADIENIYLTEINEYYDGDSFFERDDLLSEHFYVTTYKDLGDNCLLKIYRNRNISYMSDISIPNYVFL